MSKDLPDPKYPPPPLLVACAGEPGHRAHGKDDKQKTHSVSKDLPDPKEPPSPPVSCLRRGARTLCSWQRRAWCRWCWRPSPTWDARRHGLR